jgi:hypothetical protein
MCCPRMDLLRAKANEGSDARRTSCLQVDVFTEFQQVHRAPRAANSTEPEMSQRTRVRTGSDQATRSQGDAQSRAMSASLRLATKARFSFGTAKHIACRTSEPVLTSFVPFTKGDGELSVVLEQERHNCCRRPWTLSGEGDPGPLFFCAKPAQSSSQSLEFLLSDPQCCLGTVAPLHLIGYGTCWPEY